MARMLGEKLLPNSINTQRRRVRERVMDLREPIRQRRIELVPGPNVVEEVESRLRATRDSFVSRDSIMNRIEELRSDDSGNGSSGESEGQSNAGDGNRGRTSETVNT
jgi:hypothetical protein